MAPHSSMEKTWQKSNNKLTNLDIGDKTTGTQTNK
jgi:hypothetical protein